MCWGVPAVVKKILDDGLRAVVDFGDGIEREVVIGISDEEISVGDTVIVHAGVIISRLDERDIEEHKRYIEELLREVDESLGRA